MKLTYFIDQNKPKVDDLYYYFLNNDIDFSPKLSSRVILSDYALKLVNNANFILIRENSSNAILGVVAFYMNEKDKIAFLSSFHIVKEYRRRGIATFLLEYLINFLKKEEFKKLSLEVDKSNTKAKDLYLKLGFNVSEIITQKYSFLMTKTL